MTITVPMLILLVFICLFVGGLIGWGLFYWYFRRVFNGSDI